MSWFAAHIIMAVKLKGGDQSRFPVWENIVLIGASSVDEANTKAEQRGRQEQQASRERLAQQAQWV